MWVVDQLYDGLVELAADLTVAPCLATRWTFDAETLTYRFSCARTPPSRQAGR